jgi:cell division protein FtsL
MKLKDKMRASSKANLLKGGLLTIFLFPLAVVTVLKLIYVVLHNEALFSKFSEGFIRLLAKFALIRWLWPFTPSPSVNPLLTWGNFFALLLVGFTAWAVALVGSAYSTYNRLRKAKWDSDNDQLRDDFRQ